VSQNVPYHCSPFCLLLFFVNQSLVQDAVQNKNENAVDGTTTATVLAQSIYSEGVKKVAAGCNLMDLR
jgi:chaperonin GroEL (HSP60 family)